MSYKDDALQHRIEEQQRAYVASELGIDPATLRDHPFEIQEDVQQGETVSWSVYWEGDAPEGVATQGSGGTNWTTLAAPPRTDTGDDE